MPEWCVVLSALMTLSMSKSSPVSYGHDQSQSVTVLTVGTCKRDRFDVRSRLISYKE